MTTTESARRGDAPATASTAPASSQSGPPEEAVRYRLGFRRRWMLRRQGRLDGSRRHPDPLLLTGPVTTSMRRLLLEEYADAAAAVKKELTAEVARLIAAWAEHGAAARQARTDLPVAEQALADALATRPDPDAPPERRLGEERRPEALVRARRLREHERAVEVARQEQLCVRARLWTSEQEQARLRSQVDNFHRQAVDQVYRLRASYQRGLAIYDRALLRRHPDGDLLRDLLVTRDPALPEWTYRPAGPFPSEA
jgi:hypothetical protein